MPTPTLIFLTSGTSWTVPLDRNNNDNSIECIGGGGGTAGQIGMEETPEAYVTKIVAVFRQVRRVLKSHGTL